MAPLATSGRQEWHRLALASFDEAWTTIRDTYHDPTFGGLDWEAVRDELRPRAEAARSPDEVRVVIRDLIGRLGASHFELIPAGGGGQPSGRGGPGTIGIDVRVVDQQIVVTRVDEGSTAAAAGLLPGQTLLAVDDEPAARWLAGSPDAEPRDRQLEIWQQATGALRGAEGSRARIRVRERGGRERTIEVTRERERGQVARFGNLPELSVRVDVAEARTPGARQAGVIGFSLWMPGASGPIAEAVDRFRGADALIFDLRGNLGGLVEMLRGVAGHVIDEPVSLGRMQTRGTELEFRVNPRRSTPDGRRVSPFDGPVAVLVDELTASASECFAGGLQSLGRARVFGAPTMGQALPAATRALPNGDILMYVVGDFVTPTGQRLEGRGVEPDVEVPLSIAALQAGRDPVLDAALAWVDEVSRRSHLP